MHSGNINRVDARAVVIKLEDLQLQVDELLHNCPLAAYDRDQLKSYRQVYRELQTLVAEENRIIESDAWREISNAAELAFYVPAVRSLAALLTMPPSSDPYTDQWAERFSAASVELKRRLNAARCRS